MDSEPLISSPFGRVDGKPVDLFTLTNAAGVVAKLTSYGARLTELHLPDWPGKAVNVVLGYERLEQYLQPEPYFGCTVGRVANRIARGAFELEGTRYQLFVNNAPNTLHGGKQGFDKRVWDAEAVASAAGPSVRFTYRSVDVEEGYPGNVTATVTYTLTEANELRLDYTAVTDAPTPINLTNHTYFNLAGAGTGTILDHELSIAAESYLPVDDTLIPTGELRPVDGTPMDFRRPTVIGQRIKAVGGPEPVGYDHNWVLSRDAKVAGNPLRPAAFVLDPVSGRSLQVSTTCPGVQFYSGNFLDGSTHGNGGTYVKHGGLCLETQHFPDSVNRPGFPTTILRPGERYEQTTIYELGGKF